LKTLFPTAHSALWVTICSSCLYDSFESDKQYLEVPVLNGNVKLAYAEDRWDCKAREDGIACLEEVVCSFENVLKRS
jgi:hypothetical protein